jgi:hypothetical protein
LLSLWAAAAIGSYRWCTLCMLYSVFRLTALLFILQFSVLVHMASTSARLSPSFWFIALYTHAYVMRAYAHSYTHR